MQLFNLVNHLIGSRLLMMIHKYCLLVSISHFFYKFDDKRQAEFDRSIIVMVIVTLGVNIIRLGRIPWNFITCLMSNLIEKVQLVFVCRGLALQLMMTNN